MKAKDSTFRLAYESFIESVLAFHLSIIHGHMSVENRNELNHVIKSAYRLSNKKLKCKSLDELYQERFKSKCLRTYTSLDPPIELVRLHSGRFCIPKQRVNIRKNCFRTECARLLNSIL